MASTGDAIQQLVDAAPIQTFEIPNGETLSYRVYNSKEKGTVHTLVVLGGFAGDGSLLAAELAVLPQFSDHLLIGVNPRGWGASTFNNPIYTHEENADDVKAVLEGIGIGNGEERVMVMGHSSGGPIAALLAIRYPETIKAAFLKNSIPINGFCYPIMSPEGVPTGRFALTDEEMAGHCAFVRSLGFLSEDEEVCRNAWNSFCPIMPQVGTFAMKRFHEAATHFRADIGVKGANSKFNITPIKTLRTEPAGHLLHNLQVPIIVMHGSADSVINPMIARSVTNLAIVERWAPQGLLSYYEHEGNHFPLLEVPHEWADVYLKALQEQVVKQNNEKK